MKAKILIDIETRDGILTKGQIVEIVTARMGLTGPRGWYVKNEAGVQFTVTEDEATLVEED